MERRPGLSMLGIGIAALAVRLLGIASRPIWYDEAFSILFSEKGPGAMLRGTLSPAPGVAGEIHPPTYYTTLWLWMRVFGESPAAVRGFSIVAGIAVVMAIYTLTRSLFGSKTALAAGALAALSPFQVQFAQEIRMYVFLCLWLLLATYCYWRGIQGPGWRWWAGFAGFAALAQYTHSLAVFYLVALAAWPVLTRSWRIAGRVAAAGLAAVVLYIPWLMNLPGQFATVDRSYWIDKPAPYRLFTLLLIYLPNLPLPGWQLAAGLMAAVLITAIAVLQTIKAIRQRLPGAAAGAWLLYLSFAPAGLLYVFSQWIPIYLERALLPSGAVFCAWLAWALMGTRAPRPVQVAAVCLTAAAFGLGLYNHFTYAGFPYAPYRPMTTSIEGRMAPGDAVIHSSKLSMLPAVYYDRSLPQTFVRDTPGSGQDTLSPSMQEVMGLMAQPDIKTAAGSASRVWFLLFDQSDKEFADTPARHHPQLIWLMENYSLLKTEHWGDLCVYLFAAR